MVAAQIDQNQLSGSEDVVTWAVTVIFGKKNYLKNEKKRFRDFFVFFFEINRAWAANTQASF